MTRPKIRLHVEIEFNTMNKILLFFLFIFILSCNHEKQKNKISKTLTDELQKISATGLIHGFSVSIVNDKSILYQRGFGVSDLKNKKPYTVNTIQKVGSISKVIIGLALLKAQELGKLDLDDPISKYLSFDISNPNFPNEKITLRQLANHTSSIVDTKYYDENVYILKDDQGFNGIEEMNGVFKPSQSQISMPEFIKKLLSKEEEWYLKEGFTEFKPGTNYKYTNIGAALAAYILEIATEESYQSFTQKNIFKHLRMSSSGWSFETFDSSNVSNLYYGHKQVPFYKLQSYPDGGLFTSLNDLSLLLNELIKGQSGTGDLLKTKSYYELFGSKKNSDSINSIKKENPAFSVKYDSCIFMGKTQTGYFGHTGSDLGLVSLMFFNADDKLGQIVTVNTHIDGNNEKILKELWLIWDKLEEYKTKLNY